MLKIKQKFHIPLPRFTGFASHTMQLSSQEPENDELIEAIDDEAVANDDDWQLEERPNTTELSQYWNKVEDDIEHDPKWIQVDD